MAVGRQQEIITSDGDSSYHSTYPLRQTGYQIYSEAVHRLSPRHNDHQLPHGYVTSAVAGLAAHTLKDRTRATTHRRRLATELPWDLIARKLTDHDDASPASSDMRFEMNCQLDLHKMAEDKRNGL